jgi:hypothetical protein
VNTVPKVLPFCACFFCPLVQPVKPFTHKRSFYFEVGNDKTFDNEFTNPDTQLPGFRFNEDLRTLCGFKNNTIYVLKVEKGWNVIKGCLNLSVSLLKMLFDKRKGEIMLNHMKTDRVERGEEKEKQRDKQRYRRREIREKQRQRQRQGQIDKERQTEKKKDKQRQKDRQKNKEGSRQRGEKDRDGQREKQG